MSSVWENVTNAEWNIIYVAITVDTVVPCEVVADRGGPVWAVRMAVKKVEAVAGGRVGRGCRADDGGHGLLARRPGEAKVRRLRH